MRCRLSGCFGCFGCGNRAAAGYLGYIGVVHLSRFFLKKGLPVGRKPKAVYRGVAFK